MKRPCSSRHANIRRIGWLGLTVFLWILPAHAEDSRPTGTAKGGDVSADTAADAEPSSEFAYIVNFTGMPDDDEAKLLFEKTSETLRLADSPPTSFSRLRRRANDDASRLLKVLRSRAHYAATVKADIDRSTSPITLTYRVEPGPIYGFQRIVIELDPPPEDDLDLPTPKALNLVKETRASSSKIITAESDLLLHVQRQGFAKAEIGKRRAVVDHNVAKMDITIRLAPGPKVYFGETTVAGNVDVEARFVTARVDWKPGTLVTPEKIETTRLDLIETGLFNSVRIEPGTEPDDQGRIPILIKVAEAKHRSIEASLRYRTDEGPGGGLGWEHRNLFGTGEQLGFTLEGSPIGWHLTSEFREPDFLERDQVLVIGSEFAIDNTDAFSSESIGATLGIERLVGKGMVLGAGVAFRAVTVEQNSDAESFGLLSLPASYSWDHANNLLDPSNGGRLLVKNEPFFDVLGSAVKFNRTSIAYTRYLRLKAEKPGLVLAGRAKAGFLFGAARSDVPADERFYAGGGGSVRGFGFQRAGELDESNDPIGGRSLLEFAGELRGQFTDTLGAAIFVDSGAAYETIAPDPSDGLFVGVGAGLRYFSPIGPIRLDVGVPIDPRPSDDSFQIYISIGQAF